MAAADPARTGRAEPDPKTAIRAEARRLGFDAVGFASADYGPDAKPNLEAFVAQGRHGEMDWMARNAARRSDPEVLWPAARSIIALGLNYGPDDDPLALLSRPDCGTISVYARGRDYHDVLKKKLGALARWIGGSFSCEVKLFVDTAPVMEKPAAARAGLGWQGKHTNLVSTAHGSWLFLGEIFTSLELPPDSPGKDRCGSCRRCLDICPTKAFSAPYRLDARRCISYLTIEHKGHIGREFRAAMGNRIFGCDDCLAVCPWNKFATSTAEPALAAREALTAPRLAALAALDDAAFRTLFSRSPVKRLGRDRFVRNVLIAIGNCGDARRADAAEARLGDASPLVRAMAVWALARLLDEGTFATLRETHIADETDPDVRAEWRADGGAMTAD